jgi:transmembrane sensor
MKRFDNKEAVDSSDCIRLSGNVRQDAAAWSDALREHGDNAALCRAFEQWQAKSSEHAAAFSSIDRSYGQALSVAGSGRVMAMRSQALARVSARNKRNGRRHAVLAAGLAAAVVVVMTATMLSGGTWEGLQQLQERARYALSGDTLYRTAPGERLAVTLQDGTLLTLNTDSRAVVRYRNATRNVTLVNGQALFEVAKDPDHPFVVTAGGRKITALGTAFDVRVSDDRFAVTLIEGRVSVEPEAVGRNALSKRAEIRTELSPGEQLIVASTAIAPVIRKADTKRTVSWRDGQMIFQNDLLTDAINEINRYGGRRIVLADDSLGTLRLSGAFNTGNVSGFVATLTSYFEVRVVEADDQRIVLGPRLQP